MSQTPEEAVGRTEAERYLQAWKTVSDWTKIGRSWSGRERNCAFLNTLDGRFANISASSGFDFPDDARGLGIVDWDHDGDLDVWTSARTAPQLRMLRNMLDNDSQFLAIRLVGTESNRDAIGGRVRVMLPGDKRPILRTVIAGHGYLSQSSKWLHFGLGGPVESVDLLVRWPNGREQTILDVAPDRHYVLTEGESRPQPWTRPTPAVGVRPSPPRIASPTSQATLPLAERLPLPQLEFSGRDGEIHPLTTTPDAASEVAPRLIVLWASWCRPCLEELQQLKRQRDDFSAYDLEVVMLSVNGLGDDETTRDDADAMCDRLGFPFTQGYATPELLDRLQSLNDELYTSRRPFPLPSSFLIGGDGKLVAIYRGPVEPETLLEHLEQSDSPRRKLLTTTMPFPGFWQRPPQDLRQSPYLPRGLAKLRENDLPGAEAMFRSALVHTPESIEAILQLADLLKRQGRMTEIEPILRQAVEVAPTFEKVRAQLADICMATRRMDEAKQQYEEVLRIDPSYHDAHVKLGVLSAMQRQNELAEDHFRAAVAWAPERADYRANLGKVLLDRRNYRESAVELKRAVDLDGQQIASAANLAWILAAAPDPQLRNGKLALQVASLCVKRTQMKDPSMLDKLAAAYAENGDYARAVQACQRAIDLRNRQGTGPLEARLKLYQAKKPYRLPE